MTRVTSEPFPYIRDGKWVTRRTGNRYTGSTITQREADTINRCIAKISKIAERENLHAGDRFLLESGVRALEYALKEAGRA
jgi:hypothetical protein